LFRLLNAYFPTRTLFLGISEACLVAAAFIAAAIARLGTNDAVIMLNYEQGFLKILVVSAAFIACMYYFDLYDSSILNNPREVHTRLIQMQGTVCLILAGLYYMYPPLELGRRIFVIGFILVAIVLLLWRHFFLTLNGLPQFAERALILGNSPLGDSLVAELKCRPILGIRVVGQLKSFEENTGDLQPISDEEKTEALLSAINPYKPDRIIVAFSERRGGLPFDAFLRLQSFGVKIQDGREVYEAVTGKVPLESLGLSWLLSSAGLQLSQPLLIYKRAASLVLSVLALILASPAIVLISLAIRLDSQGPVIFRQPRVGKEGKIFTLYKFRTMVDGADRDGNYRPAETVDSRFTGIGRLLRRTRMDELPQLFNILRGDMHFIGPRPFVFNQEQECVEKIPYYRLRWAVKPGATGWAQINRGYNVSIADNQEKLAYDLFYIRNFSFGLDLLIFLKTIKILILGRGSR
jgi:exopolysaccharide biosynthesis polyprenyl glycosylphosphotransferase